MTEQHPLTWATAYLFTNESSQSERWPEEPYTLNSPKTPLIQIAESIKWLNSTGVESVGSAFLEFMYLFIYNDLLNVLTQQ